MGPAHKPGLQSVHVSLVVLYFLCHTWPQKCGLVAGQCPGQGLSRHVLLKKTAALLKCKTTSYIAKCSDEL